MMKQAWLAMGGLVFSCWAGALAQDRPPAKATVKAALVEPEKRVEPVKNEVPKGGQGAAAK
jgi:hypothetical protein